MIRRLAWALVAATAAPLALAVTVSTSASADAPPAASQPPAPDHATAIPLGFVKAMLVDPADGLVFYAGGDHNLITDVGVAVSDIHGAAMRTVPGTSSALALALGADRRIYVAENERDIASIDPTTLAVTHYPIAAAGCPTSLAPVGTTIWFSYRCGPSEQGGVAELDLQTGAVSAFPFRRYAFTPQVAAVPNHPNLLIGSDITAAGRLSLFDISGTTPTELATAVTSSPQRPEGIDGPRITVTPDGSTVLATSFGLRGAASFSTTDLTPGPVTYSVALPTSTALSADGDLVAVAAASDQTLTTFHAGVADPIRAYLRSPLSTERQDSPVATAWIASTVLAVYAYENGDSPMLNVLNSAQQTPSTMTLTAPATAGRATTVPLTGQLVGRPNTAVLIAKRDLAGAHILATVTTDSDGRFSYIDLARVGGPNTYLARYIGDQTHGPIDRTMTVAVSRGTVPLTLRIDRSDYNFHDTAHLSIHLASHDVKKVQVWAKTNLLYPGYLTTLTVDGAGNAQLDVRMAYNTVFVVKFYGDYYYNPRSVGVIGRTRALVQLSLDGQTGQDGMYQVFCCTAGVHASVAPATADNNYVRFETQRYLLGQWVTAPGPGYLNYRSPQLVDGQFSRSRYGLYRMRAVYHSDQYNIGNVSPWAYLEFPGWV